MKSLHNYEVSDRLPVREWAPSFIQIRQYAEATGDFNPVHLDDNYARRAGLGGVVAHGMLTMAQMAAMLTDWSGIEGGITKLKVRFEGVVRPGDTINCTGFIRARSEKTLVCVLEAFNDKNERILSGLAHIKINPKWKQSRAFQ